MQTAGASALGLDLIDSLLSTPVLTIPMAAGRLKVTYASAQLNVEKLIKRGILKVRIQSVEDSELRGRSGSRRHSRAIQQPPAGRPGKFRFLFQQRQQAGVGRRYPVLYRSLAACTPVRFRQRLAVRIPGHVAQPEDGDARAARLASLAEEYDDAWGSAPPSPVAAWHNVARLKSQCRRFLLQCVAEMACNAGGVAKAY